MPSALPEGVHIESMQAGDIAQVLAIDAASFRSHGTTEENLREELTRPWARLWVLREGVLREGLLREGLLREREQVAAFLVAWYVVDEVHVINVATSPALRRRGHARALMHHLIAFAKSQRVRMILLEVRPSNGAAVALYRSLGFFAMGLRRGYYSDGEDAVEMMLTFDPDTQEIIPRADEVQVT